MTVMRGADALVETMAEYDTELVVGFIGHTSHEVADALADHPTIRSLHPVTEFGGGFMVNGYNAVKGRAAAVAVWHTIGSFVALAPVYEAQIARIPSIHIGMNVDGVMKDREAMQEMPNYEIFRNVTQFSTRVERPDKLPEALHKAFQMGQSGRRGPAFLDVPFDITIDVAETTIPRGWHPPSTRLSADPSDVTKIAEMLREAERPAILLGGGAAQSEAGAEALELAELLCIPIATTSTGLGTVPGDHPLCMGLAGTVGWPTANDVIADADVVLVAGGRIADWGYAQAWAAELSGKLIHIDTDAEQLGSFYFPEVSIVGDAKAVLGQVAAEVKSSDADPTPYHEQGRFAELSGAKAKWLEEMEERSSDPQFPMNPWRVVSDVQAALGDDDIIVTDVGNNAAWVLQGCVVHKPRRLLAPWGVGSLGTAFPMALGAKLAEPENSVVVITGDGGVQYSLNEIATAQREGISVVVVVLNNGVLGSNDGFMRHLYGEAQWIELHNPDFPALARAYGGGGERVESADGVEAAVRRGIEHGGVYIVDVPIGAEHGYAATGAGPTVRWEPRMWPADATGGKMPDKHSESER